MNRKRVTKAALALSVCIMMLWGILGTGTSIAWFMDETPTEQNVFDIGILDLVVSHEVSEGNYEIVDAETSIFDDEALYEPGYVQVVYLKIENAGDVDFDYNMSVIPTSVTPADNVYGGKIWLPDHLKFGVVFDESVDNLKAKLANRDLAKVNAVEDMGTYFEFNNLSQYMTTSKKLEAGETVYAAIVLCMPEYVGNEANYRGDTPPQIDLGINVKATQIGTSN